MYQRSAKMSKPMGDGTISPMLLTQFVKQCKLQLESAGYEDCAFYFEQIEDSLREGKSITSDPKKVQRILGL